MKEILKYLLWCSIIDWVPLDWWLFGDQSRIGFCGRLVICFWSKAGGFELDPARLVVVHAKNWPLVLTGYHLEHVRHLGYDLEQTAVRMRIWDTCEFLQLVKCIYVS